MLDEHIKISDIASILDINIHRIYDAIYSNKLKRPNNYLDGDFHPIVQLDENSNLIGDYDSISSTEKATGVKSGNIVSAFKRDTHYSSGFYWFDKKEYLSGNIKIKKSRFSKFNIPVNMYDKNNNLICTYKTILDASKELGVNNYSIFEVVNGNRKSIKGYIFKKVS